MSHKSNTVAAESNGLVVTVTEAAAPSENPSIGFTLPRALVNEIDLCAERDDLSRSEFLRKIIAERFSFELPIVKRGRTSSYDGWTEAEKTAEIKRKSILSIIDSRAQKLALSVDVMNAIKSGRMLSEDELKGAILRHTSALIAEHATKHKLTVENLTNERAYPVALTPV